MNRRGVNLPTVVSGRNGHSTRLSIYNNAEVPMYWVRVRICSTAFRQIFQWVGLLQLLSDCSWDERFTPHSIDSYLSRDHTDLVLKPKPQGNGGGNMFFHSSGAWWVFDPPQQSPMMKFGWVNWLYLEDHPIWWVVRITPIYKPWKNPFGKGPRNWGLTNHGYKPLTGVEWTLWLVSRRD